MEQELEVKPKQIKNANQAKKYANELLENWTEFCALKKRMDILNSTLKKYMQDNHMSSFKVENGELLSIKQKRNMLNRALIDDIEQYYEISDVYMLYKQPNGE